MNRLGFFLGSFDPPHIGHLQVAIECLNNKLVDKVIYVPAKQNPFKHNSLNIIHRINMLNNMINEYNLKKDVEVSSIEKDLEINKEGKVYSYLTLDILFNKLYKDYNCYWILTTETFEDLINWKNHEALKDINKLIGYNFKPYYYDFTEANLNNHIIDYFKIYNTPHSSDLRQLIQENKIVYPFISKSVCSYIKQNNLYI